jgi:hypothetical protein
MYIYAYIHIHIYIHISIYTGKTHDIPSSAHLFAQWYAHETGVYIYIYIYIYICIYVYLIWI